MVTLIQFLADYLNDKVLGAQRAAPNGEHRIFFVGPPQSILEDLLEYMTAGSAPDGSGETRGRAQFPVFLIDAAAVDPAVLRSGRCTPGYVTNVRNSNCKVYVALQPPGVATMLTLASAMSTVGIAGDPSSATGWLAESLIDHIVRAALQKHFGPNVPPGAVVAANYALEEVWRADDADRERPQAWALLQRLFDCPDVIPDPLARFLSVLGMVNCTAAELGSAEHCKVLERLAGTLESSGIRAGLESLGANARDADAIRTHLAALSEHLSARCRAGSDFAAAPLRYYAPDSSSPDGAPPVWWRELTLEHLSSLLDSPDGPPDAANGLSVVCRNPLCPSIRGMPTVTLGGVTLSLAVNGLDEPVLATVFRANGSRPLEQVASIEIDPENGSDWTDEEIPKHDRHLRYKFECPGLKSVSLRVIVLEMFTPGVVIYARTASKVGPFQVVSNRGRAGQRAVDYSCDLQLQGVGAHQIDIYSSSWMQLAAEVVGHDVTADQSEAVCRPINPSGPNHSVCVIDADEECSYEMVNIVNETAYTYRVLVEAGEYAPIGARSEFDRLLIEHKSAARAEPGIATVEPANCRVAELQIWALDSKDSYHPVLLGPDYLDAWSTPEWLRQPVLSRSEILADPRPTADEFCVPAEYATAREEVMRRLRSRPDEPGTPVESMRLGELMANGEFRDAIVEYLQRYRDWLTANYAAAAWSDLVVVHQREAGGNCLEATPRAVLMTPLHPLRLAWQCHAQVVLRAALDEHRRCPGASAIDPSAFPDCLVLPCRNAAGRQVNQAYVSMRSTSDYWAVLWHKDRIGDLAASEASRIFDPGFGIAIEGLTGGFTEQQVVRSLDEAQRLAAGRTTLRVSLLSDTSGSSACNAGIAEWCGTQLGEDADPWHAAGPRGLHVYDRRDSPLHPEQAALASLTARSDAAVRWFSRPGDVTSDLAIIAHLGVASPTFQTERLRSAVDQTGLLRRRIRKQLTAHGGAFVAESRIGRFPAVEDHSQLNAQLLLVLDVLESKCASDFDSYVFAPLLQTLGSALKQANYCAVSSSTVDAACFLRASDTSYLWDYELPPYSRRAGGNGGFYLLAGESKMMRQSVRTALRSLKPNEEVDGDGIRSLLREISRRGMPTLKRLTMGGTESLGELGLLVALRLLQTEFQESAVAGGIAAVASTPGVFNILIPADPFRHHFDDLRGAMQGASLERPDLIVASIRADNGVPTQLRLTCIEVKAREGLMNASELAHALDQARKFSEFLKDLSGRAADSPLWGLSWREVLSSWLDYGFRVYGQIEPFVNDEMWTGLHEATLSGIMAGSVDTKIDPRGRLIVIDASVVSRPDDVDHDRFRETVVLSHADAYSLLCDPEAPIRAFVLPLLGDWGLAAERAGEAVTIPEVPRGEVAEDMDIQPDEERDAPVVDDEDAPIGHVPEDEAMMKPSGLAFSVGATTGAFQSLPVLFSPGDTRLNQLNVGIVGDLGTGKTQLIQALIQQLRERPETNRGSRPRVLIFDYKNDYSKLEFVQRVGARVIRPRQLPLNLFDTRDSSAGDLAWLERSKFFCDVLDKLYAGIGPRQRERIKEAIKQSYARAKSLGFRDPTIYDVFEAYSGLANGAIDVPYSIMSDLVDGEYFARDPDAMLAFSDFLSDVVVVDLSAVGADDRTKNMLVVVFLNLFYEHMLRIEKRPFLGTNPKFRFVDTLLLVDEADNIMKHEFEVLKRILLQGREFGVGVLLASQYLSHFRTQHENYVEPLLTWFVHKVPNITVKELESIGLTNVDVGMVERVKMQACHECLYKTHDVGGAFVRATPFFELPARPVLGA